MERDPSLGSVPVRDRSRECQICGRNQKLTGDGTIAHHHYHGDPCLGRYSPPASESTESIVDAINHWTEEDNRRALRLRQHRENRENEPLPGWFWEAWLKASRERARLIRRLRNLQKDTPNAS